MDIILFTSGYLQHFSARRVIPARDFRTNMALFLNLMNRKSTDVTNIVSQEWQNATDYFVVKKKHEPTGTDADVTASIEFRYEGSVC